MRKITRLEPSLAREAAWDIQQYGQRAMTGLGVPANDVNPDERDSSLLPLASDDEPKTFCSVVLGPFEDEKLASRAAWSERCAGYFKRILRYIRRERQIARDIAGLSSLDDGTLHDMGIHRSQIAHIVRHGLDDFDRLRSRPL